MKLLREKDGHANIRLIVLVFVVLSGIAAALLFYPPITTRTAEERSSGDVAFIDRTGNPLGGRLEISGAGISSGEKSNVNFISWSNIPNARIGYNALDIKNISLDLRISGDSLKSIVILENYGINMPGGVNVSAPGIPVKYLEISSVNLSIVEAKISVQYADTELNGIDENNLTIYHYDREAETWSELPTVIDADNNILNTTVGSLSFFAVSTKLPGTIEIRDSRKKRVVSDVKTYDEARVIKMGGKTSTLTAADIPDNGDLEVDAIQSKNVKVSLKIDKQSSGEIILDDYGKKNPVPVPPPARVVKFVEIGARNISFSGAEVTIHYSDAELNGVNESTLAVYHWEGAKWDVLETTRDGINNILSANTTSLSPFAIAGQVEMTGITHPGGDISDCVSCHNVSGSSAQSMVDTAAIKQGIHKGLNSNATNTSALDPINKACWACHTNGTEHNTTIITTGCLACHNRTVNLTYTDAGRRADLTYNKVYDHIQKPYAESLYSDAWDPGVNCTACHKKSMGIFNDSGAVNATIYSNISHYATNTNLIKPSTNCSLCHQSPGVNATWYANLTRHPAKSRNYTFCANCHNSTNATTLHSRPLIWTPTIHGYQGNAGFDWEGDDATSGTTGSLAENDESCAACHSGVLTRLCENCHLPNTTSLFTGPFNPGSVMRKDINDTLPYVYSHTNYSGLTGVNVPPQNNPYYATGCYYYNNGTMEGTCHGNSFYNSSSSGGYYAFKGSSTVRNISDPAHRTKTIDRLPDTTDCLYCHNQPNLTIRRSWGNASQVNNTDMFGNRYDASKNESCYICHTTGSSKPSDFHSSEVVIGGGPGCLGCHNTSTPQNYTGMHYIDGGNFSIAIHEGMNAANGTTTGYGMNASCWACHSSNGSYVADNTHPDRTTTPYNCTECHLAGGNRTGAYNATIIYNHYRNGTAITALSNKSSDIASCIECHENVSGMIKPNNDQDTGSFAGDDIGATGGRNSSYHYGANRSNFNRPPGSFAYCAYCHGNDTGEFNTTFQGPANRNISNHSVMYNSSNPTCSDALCHNSSNSSLHGIELSRPVIALPNSSYCLGCHGNNGTGYPVYNGSITGYKEKHNNTVECTQCHLDTGKSIHPVRYLQKDLTWNTSNASSVACTACHQGAGIGGFDNAPKVSIVQHSANPTNGSIWNKANPYWTNTSQQSMCDYCHGDSRHKATALGRPANWNGSNTINPTITNKSNWCSGCHYQGYSSGGKNYTNMVSTYAGNNLPVPPEITNSTYAPDGVSGYYNHSLTPDYNDSTCKGCHGNASSTKIGEVLHGLSTGTCKDCHFSFEFMNSSGAPTKYVNQSMYNNSSHGSLECEDCHTKGHNNIGARKSCEDCHAVSQNPKNSTERHNITGDPRNYSIPGIGPVLNITDCTACHDSNLYNNATASYGLPPKPRNCDYCHTYPDSTYT